MYLAFAADPGRQERGDKTDVFVVRSTDGGKTWGDPVNVVKGRAVRANPDETTNDNWMPVLTVGGAGEISIFFYDRRNDRRNRKIDVYRAVSTDQGQTWVNERVTGESFDVPPLNPNFDPLVKNCYMGDYNDGALAESGAQMSWGDNRRLVKTPRYPRGRPDPDVRFRVADFQP